MELSKEEKEVVKFSMLMTLQSLNRVAGSVPGLNKKLMINSIEKLLRKFD